MMKRFFAKPQNAFPGFRLLALLAGFIFIWGGLLWNTGCGRENPSRTNRVQSGPSQPDPDPSAPAPQVTLALFGAPWCSNCKIDFPQIQALLDQLPESSARKISLVLYVTTGATAAERPTEEIAQAYLEALKLKGRAQADEWRWKRFREYVGGSLVLPGAAILSADGQVLQAFRAGAGTFIPSEIVKTAQEAIP